ncbi:MAG: DUF2147 domain-containing protein [Rhizobiales bacterium]|nr:DUF2147 domain-containing protein [Hyphomicrobiales bacterium]
MKRTYIVALLMLLSSSAFAADSTSFNSGGRRAPLETSRDCRSGTCAAPSRHSRDRYRDDDDDDDDLRYRDDRRTSEAMRALPPSPQVASPPPPAIAARPAALYQPAAATTQSVAVPPPARLTVPPAPPPPVAKQAEPARPTPPRQVSNNAEDEADAPLGDWKTEARGLVRIVRCGKALCGYVLSSSQNDQGEVVLVNMKPNSDGQWSGSVYSQASGDTYYGTVDMKGPNRLHVQACAIGRFYCSGNSWSRVDAKAESLMSSRQPRAEPRS